jgi:vancomycin resistance protein YoaR
MPLAILGILEAVLAAGYVGLCAYANSQDTFYPNYNINFIDVSGLTPEEAQAKLDEELPAFEIPLYNAENPDPSNPLLTVTLEELGFEPETIGRPGTPYGEWVGTLWFQQNERSFLYKGWDFFQHLTGNSGGAMYVYNLEGSKFEAAVDSIRQQLTVPAVDTVYTLEENAIQITKAKDGCFVDRDALKENLSLAGTSANGRLVTIETDPAQVLTAQEIYDQVAGEMKNAGYDSTTDSITPEQVGAEFDVKTTQAALDAAEPGETVKIAAEIQFPAVTAADLEAVLFRDVLGEYTTNVSGTAARKSNVKLSAASINNYVMNTGDVFSYNGVVGQRTAANGYQPAPAYVKGETVDEIGGGICQTSSTLYIACLRGNLEITERYAHRYIPAYVPAGMDATVSWGGPDYKFTNNTDYPIKIVTSYANSKLTVKILGTNVDGSYGRMTNEQLSTTAWETVYQEDETVAPGTQTVKTTAYTGSKWRTYHHIYDADGKLIDSHYEATSDYKARNKVILVAPGELPGAEPPVPVVTPIPLPENPAPVDPAPVDPSPAEPVPVEPTPAEPAPEVPESGSEETDVPIIVVPDLTEVPAE